MFSKNSSRKVIQWTIYTLALSVTAWAGPSEVLNQARQAERKSDWKHALSYYRKVSQSTEYREDGVLGMARVYFALRDMDESESLLASLLKEENPFQYQARLLHADVLIKKQKFQEAFEESTRAIRLRPKAIEGYERQSAALWGLNKKPELEALLVKMGADFPSSASLLLYRGKVRADANRFKEAAADLKEALRLRPNDLEITELLGESLTKAHLYTEAESHYQSSLKMFPNQISLIESTGHMYFKSMRYELAMEQFRRVLELDSSRLDSTYMVGQIYFKTKDYEHAEEAFKNVLRKNQAHEEAAKGLADLYRQQSVLDKYAHVLKDQVEKHPDRKWAVGQYVRLLMDMGLSDEADRMLDRVSDHVPGSPELLVMRSHVYAKRGDYKKSKQVLEECIKKFPDAKEVVFNLGLVCEQLPEEGCAEAAYLSIKDHRDVGFKATVNLAILYEKTNRFGDAIALLKNTRMPAGEHESRAKQKIRELEFKQLQKTRDTQP